MADILIADDNPGTPSTNGQAATGTTGANIPLDDTAARQAGPIVGSDRIFALRTTPDGNKQPVSERAADFLRETSAPAGPPTLTTQQVQGLISMALAAAGYQTRPQVTAAIQNALSNFTGGETETQVHDIIENVVADWAEVNNDDPIPFSKTDVAALMVWLINNGFVTQSDINAIERAISGLFDTDTLVTARRFDIDGTSYQALPFDSGKTIPADPATLMALHVDRDDDNDDATYEFPFSVLKDGTQGQNAIAADWYEIPNAIDRRSLYLAKDPDRNDSLLMQISGGAIRSARLTLTQQTLEEINVNKPTLSGNVLTFYVRIGTNIVAVPITLPTTGHAPSRHNEAANIFYERTLAAGTLSQYQQDPDANPVLAGSNFPMRLYFQDETGAAYSWAAYAEFQRTGPVTDGGAATSGNGTRIDHGTLSIFISRQRRTDGMDYWIVAPANAAAIGQRIEIQGVASTQHVPTSATAANVDPLVGALLSMHPAITYDAAANTFTYQWRQADLADNSVGQDQLQNNSVISAKIAANAVGTANIADNTITFGKLHQNAVDGVVTESQTDFGFAKIITANTFNDLLNENTTYGTVLAFVGTNLDYNGTDYKVGDLLLKTGPQRWAIVSDAVAAVQGTVPASETNYSILAQFQTARQDLRLRFRDTNTELQYGNGIGSILDNQDLTDGQVDGELLGIRYVKATRELTLWTQDPSTGGRFDDKIVLDGTEYTLTGGNLSSVPFGTGNARGLTQTLNLPADAALTGTDHAINLADSHADREDEYFAGDPKLIHALLDPARLHPNIDFSSHVIPSALVNNTDPFPTNKITFPNQLTPEIAGLSNFSLYFRNGELYALPDNDTEGIKIAYNRDIGQQDFPTWDLRGYNRADRIFIPGRRHTDEARADQTARFPAYQPRSVPGPAGTTRTYHTTTATNIADPADNIEFVGPQDYRTSLRNRFIISQHGRGLDRYGALTFKIYNPDTGVSSESSYTLTPHNRVDLITPVVAAADRIPATGAVRGVNFQTSSDARPFIYLMDESNIDEAYDISTLGSHSRFQTAYATDNRVWANFRGLIDGEFSTTDYTTFKQEDIPYGVDVKIDLRSRNTGRIWRDITIPSGYFRDLTPITISGADRRENTTDLAEVRMSDGNLYHHAPDTTTTAHTIRLNRDEGNSGDNFRIGFFAGNGVIIFKSDHNNYYTQPIFNFKW